MTNTNATPATPDGLERVRTEFLPAILHGDETHRAWLSEAVDCFLAGKPVPPPTGTGMGVDALNHKAPEPDAVEATLKPEGRSGSGERRWRVYVDKRFSFVVHAPSQEAAEAEAIAIFPCSIRVRPVTAK
jgi:hypothetical protein